MIPTACIFQAKTGIVERLAELRKIRRQYNDSGRAVPRAAYIHAGKLAIGKDLEDLKKPNFFFLGEKQGENEFMYNRSLDTLVSLGIGVC